MEVRLKKGEGVILIVEGMEGFPIPVPHEDIVEVVAQRVANDIRMRRQETHQAMIEKKLAAQGLNSGASCPPFPSNSLTNH